MGFERSLARERACTADDALGHLGGEREVFGACLGDEPQHVEQLVDRFPPVVPLPPRHHRVVPLQKVVAAAPATSLSALGSKLHAGSTARLKSSCDIEGSQKLFEIDIIECGLIRDPHKMLERV